MENNIFIINILIDLKLIFEQLVYNTITLIVNHDVYCLVSYKDLLTLQNSMKTSILQYKIIMTSILYI